MRRKGCSTLLACLLALTATGAAAETITLRADEWCPYNCEPGSERPGYMIEIAQEVFGEAGFDVDYQTLNWMRSIAESRAGRYAGIIGAIREEAPDFVFGEPLGLTNNGFALRPDMSLDTTDPDPLHGLTLAVIRGYNYSDVPTAYIEAHGEDRSLVQFTAGDNALEQNLRKLIAGRVDVVVDDLNVLRRAVHELGFEDETSVIAWDDPDEVHIAFSPREPNAETYAALLADGVERLRRMGRLEEIMARYGLSDWRSPLDH